MTTLQPLTVTKDSSSSSVNVGQTFTYTIRVTNTTTTPITNVVIRDFLPEQVRLINVVSSKGTVNQSNPIVNSINVLNPMETVTLTITVIACTSGIVTNGVIVTGDNVPNAAAVNIIQITPAPSPICCIPPVCCTTSQCYYAQCQSNQPNNCNCYHNCNC